jgi:hypothetical protein
MKDFEQLLIKIENEKLTNGELPLCLLFDDHRLHIKCHRKIENNKVIGHIKEHIKLYKEKKKLRLKIVNNDLMNHYFTKMRKE